MTYTKQTWATGDTITASKLNHMEDGIEGGGSGYDAVILLTHEESTALDTTSSITPSIVAGTYAEIAAKLEDGEPPNILVLYYHELFHESISSNVVYVFYYSPAAPTPHFVLRPYMPFYTENNSRENVMEIGELTWSSTGTIDWY